MCDSLFLGWCVRELCQVPVPSRCALRKNGRPGHFSIKTKKNSGPSRYTMGRHLTGNQWRLEGIQRCLAGNRRWWRGDRQRLEVDVF